MKQDKDIKTSIEQVAELPGMQLRRKQQLISADDRGHRWVAERDEELAKKSTRENLDEIRRDA